MTELGIPAGKVRNLAEVYEWEQTRSQGLLIEVDHAALGSIELPGPPLRFEPAPTTEHTAPPTLNQHGRRDPGVARFTAVSTIHWHELDSLP